MVADRHPSNKPKIVASGLWTEKSRGPRPAQPLHARPRRNSVTAAALAHPPPPAPPSTTTTVTTGASPPLVECETPPRNPSGVRCVRRPANVFSPCFAPRASAAAMPALPAVSGASRGSSRCFATTSERTTPGICHAMPQAPLRLPRLPLSSRARQTPFRRSTSPASGAPARAPEQTSAPVRRLDTGSRTAAPSSRARALTSAAKSTPSSRPAPRVRPRGESASAQPPPANPTKPTPAARRPPQPGGHHGDSRGAKTRVVNKRAAIRRGKVDRQVPRDATPQNENVLVRIYCRGS